MKNLSVGREVFEAWVLLRGKVSNDIPVIFKEMQKDAIMRLLAERASGIKNVRIKLAAVKDNSGGCPKLLNDLNRSLLDLESKIDSLGDGLNMPFELVIVGMGKVGKSTLINALIAKRVADVDVLPKTWKTDLYMNSANTMARIIYRDGKVEESFVDEVKKIVEQEEKKREESEDLIFDKYRELSGKFNTIEDKEQIKQELYQKYLYKSSIREINWPVVVDCPESILKSYVVVDTPGLWQINGGNQQENISDYYHQADGVIWVLDATTLSASKPKKMLDDLDFALQQAGVKRFGNIIAVLNRMDSAIPDGNQMEINRIVAEAKKIFGDRFVDVIPFSAKRALASLDKDGSLDFHHKNLFHFYWMEVRHIILR